MDRSITDISLEVMPIFITRAVAESGGIITGGAAQVGPQAKDHPVVAEWPTLG